MANTTNFNWETPDDTDLVKDGAAAMRTLGNSIDTSFVDLKGGTTGQILSKASNTDLDYTWVTTDDANAIQNTIVDAKGDLIGATAADTPARLAVGTNGQVLTADSTAATGLAWATPSGGTNAFYAGKNKIINGDFNVNQRGFTSVTTDGTYGFDRWALGTTTGTTYSAQTFTPGTAPVAGYEGTNFARIATTGQSGTNAISLLYQRMEGVRTFAGQTVVVSFWAKAGSGTPKVAIEAQQNFGSGGSTTVNTYAGQITTSTSWARYSVSVAMPSISGKTIGTGNFLALQLWTSAGTDFNDRTNSLGIQNATIDFWGVQVEAGSTATDFQTATGTLQGELAACQRYYYLHASGTQGTICNFLYFNSTTATAMLSFPVTMRTAPTLVSTTGTSYYAVETGSNLDLMNSFTLAKTTTTATQLYNASESSGTVGLSGVGYTNNASASIAFSAEL
jgi:hypothetical protein